MAVIVCHWPSQFSGSFYRESGARQTKAVKDSLLRLNPEMKVFVMGDMNDDPTSKSMYEVLRAKPEISEVGEGMCITLGITSWQRKQRELFTTEENGISSTRLC